MSFKVTIRDENGELLDELETDCLAGALHILGSEEYQGMFYADCDGVTALHTLRTAMQTIADNMADDEIVQAAEDDGAQLVEEKPKGVN